MQKNRFISLFLILSLLTTYSPSAHAGFWGTVKNVGKIIGKGVLYGTGFSIGSRVANNLMDWMSGKNKKPSHKSSTNKDVTKGINQIIANNKSYQTQVGNRLNSIENQIQSLGVQLSKLENKVQTIEDVLTEIQKTQLAQSEQIKLNTLLLERIQINQMRESVLNEITSGAENAFNKDKESSKNFIKQQIKKIKETTNPLEREERLTLLSAVIGETQALMNSTDSDGISILSTFEKSEILELSDVFMEELSTVTNIDKNLKNQFLDSIELGKIEAQTLGIQQLDHDWKATLVNKEKLPSEQALGLKNKVKQTLDQKGTPNLRNLLNELENQITAPDSTDEALILYRNLVKELQDQSITSSQFQEIVNYLNHLLSQKQDKYGESSVFLADALLKMKNEKDDFFHKLYLRDIAGPCIAFLKEKIPGISERYLKDQVELTLLKLAWAYADAIEDESADYKEKIDDIYSLIDINASNQALLEEFLAKPENQNFNTETLNKIKTIQSEKHKDSQNEKYLINYLDNYTIGLSQKVNSGLSLVGLLELIYSAYNHPEYKGYPKAKFQSSINSLTVEINKYNDEIKQLLATNQCKEYNKVMQTCHELDKNFEYISLITQIEDLQDTVNNVSDEDLKIKKYQLNNGKEVEKQKKIVAQKAWDQKQAEIAKKNAQDKAAKLATEKAARFEKCKTAPAKLKGSIIYVYKNHKLTQYSKILQPGQSVKIDFESRVSLNSVPIKDINGVHIGWVSPQSIDLKENQACLNELF